MNYTNQKAIWRLIRNSSCFCFTANEYNTSKTPTRQIINKVRHENVGKGSVYIFWALQWCYLSRPWWAAAVWWGRAPVLPSGENECWSMNAPSETSSRGRTPGTERQCWQPSGKREPQIPSLLPGLEENKVAQNDIHTQGSNERDWHFRFQLLVSTTSTQHGEGKRVEVTTHSSKCPHLKPAE